MRDETAFRREPVAVVGFSALCPGDPTTDGFIRTIFEGADQIREVPEQRFSLRDYHTDDPGQRGDRTYCRAGAFIEAVPFDPMAFGIPPSVVAATDSAQLLTLLKARELVEEAGIDRWPDEARERVSVILGAQGMTQLQALMMSRVHWPAWIEEMRAAGVPEDEARAIAARINARQPDWQEMTFPGFLGNIMAGRVTNRLDLGGTNCVVDAACASALAAVSSALNELYLGQSDVVITGGCDLLTDIGTYLAFSNSMALSRSGDCRPFSQDADGTVIGEGIVLLALRRLRDAERDGDAIHAVIRGHGTGSDGRGSAIYAPRSEGQVRAMTRAYEAAGYAPETVGLIEAHGTGTALGDATEIRSMSRVFAGPGRRRRAALGSIKSQIGHPKTSAGAVSLLKVVSALEHRILPPTIKVGEPNDALAAEGCPLHPNTVARPWIAGPSRPRRAGLSSFGFGGTNAHVTVEAYDGPGRRPERRLAFPAQLVLLSGASKAAVLDAAAEVVARARAGAALDGLARESQGRFGRDAPARLGLVARDAEALEALLARVRALLDRGALPEGTQGAAYAEGPPVEGKVAFLFPGQGSQGVGMAGDLAMHFDAARAPWDADDEAALASGLTPLHEIVFPDPALTQTQAEAQEARLRATEAAQPGLALATLSYLALAEALGLRADLLIGHSFGEVMALHAAGAFDAATAVRIARERGALMREAGGEAKGAMTSFALDADTLRARIEASGAEVSLANRNAPRQIVVSGLEAEVARLEAACAGDPHRRLPVSQAFHSPVVAPAAPRFRAFLDEVWTEPPRGAVLANATAEPYPEGIEACRETLASQIARGVLFSDSVEAAYEAGARVFVEVGPGGALSKLAAQTLEGRAEAVALDRRGANGVEALFGGLARLAVAGVPLALDALWAGRRVGSAEPPAPLSPHAVWIDSTMKRLTEASRLKGGVAEIVRTAAPPPPPAVPKPRAAPSETRQESAMAAQPQSRAAGRAEAESDAGRGGVLAAPRPAPAAASLSAASLPAADAPSPRAAAARAPALPALREEPMIEGAEALLAEVSAVQGQFLSTMAESHEAYLRVIGEALGLGTGAHPEARGALYEHAPVTPLRPEAVAAPPAASAAPWRRGEDPRPEPSPEAPASPPAEAAPEPAPALAPLDATTAMAAAIAVVAEKTGYPEDMLEPSMDLEADLGVDSIRRVEILMALRDRAPGAIDLDAVGQDSVIAIRTIADLAAFLQDLVEATPGGEGATPAAAPAAAPGAPPTEAGAPSSGAPAPEELAPPLLQPALLQPALLQPALLQIVAEKTGYPVDMLALDMALEADLGIDSIKRMEILAALGERLPGRLPPPEAIDMAAIAALRTLSDVVEALSRTGAAPGAPSEAGPRPDAAEAPAKSDASEAEDAGAAEAEAPPGMAGQPPAGAAPNAAPNASGPEAAAAPPAADASLVEALEADPAPEPEATAPEVFVPHLVEAPAARPAAPAAPDAGTVALIPDRHGAAEALVLELARRGVRAAIAEAPPEGASRVVFLAGLSPRAGAEASEALHRAAFLAAQAAAPGPSAPGLSAPGGLFVTVQATGGGFGLGGDPGGGAWSGGLAAIAKTVGKCWPGTRVRAVDLGLDPRSKDGVRALADEILSIGPEIEIAIGRDGARRRPALAPPPACPRRSPPSRSRSWTADRSSSSRAARGASPPPAWRRWRDGTARASSSSAARRSRRRPTTPPRPGARRRSAPRSPPGPRPRARRRRSPRSAAARRRSGPGARRARACGPSRRRGRRSSTPQRTSATRRRSGPRSPRRAGAGGPSPGSSTRQG